jgi:hypothetical protein
MRQTWSDIEELVVPGIYCFVMLAVIRMLVWMQ